MSDEQQVPTSRRRQLLSLYVVYDADGTFTGELIYGLKKMLGIAHCAACDITHGPRREKPEFTDLKQQCGWNVPLHNIHRDEMDDELRQSVQGQLPCVAARTSGGDVVLLEPETLDACSGSVRCLKHKVDQALRVKDIVIPGNEEVQETESSRRKVEKMTKKADIRQSLSSNVPSFPIDSPRERQEDAVVPS